MNSNRNRALWATTKPLMPSRKSDMKWLSRLSAFLFCLAGPAGALTILTDDVYQPIEQMAISPGVANSMLSYGIRFALIALAGFTMMLSVERRTERLVIPKWVPTVVWSYAVIIVLNMIVHPDSVVSAGLQLSGVLLWILYGVMLMRASGERDDAVEAITVGYLASAMAYVLYSLLFYFTNGTESFQWYTGRYVGPFRGSTVASEISYGLLIVGFLFMRKRTLLLGVMIALLSLWVTFLTGVRSSAAVSILTTAVFLIGFLRLKGKYQISPIVRTLFTLFTFAVALYIFFTADILQQRITTDQLLETGRRDIWAFAIGTYQNGSLIFGAGVRTTFDMGVSTEGSVYNSTIAWHNTWLGLLVETGILGLLSHTLLIVLAAFPLLKRIVEWIRAPRAEKLLQVGLAFIVLRYLAMSITEMNLYLALSPGVMLFGVLLGIRIIRTEGAEIRNPGRGTWEVSPR